MRKTVIYMIILSLLISLAACSNGGADNTLPPSNTGNPSSTPSEDNNNVVIPEMNPPMPLPEYPVIDGSSSTITMHAALRSYLTNETVEAEDVAHSQTYTALERLIPGNDNPADVLLSVKYYDDTLLDAKQRGADLVITPIAKEGFVFIVHKDNPVDNLTQQQLLDIYSGKITNWKEVGGKDEKILALQRNWDSGSQTAMADFMGDVPLVADDDVMYVGSMGYMLAAVALNGSAAIGYNIYSWSMGQGIDENDLKMVAVDGIIPSNKTLADDSYPLLVYTYSYYNKGNAKGKALSDWLLTAEGQKVITSAGYAGIFGELSSDTPRSFIDSYDSQTIARDYYLESGWYPDYTYSVEMVTNQTRIDALSDGKQKDVTFLWLFHCCMNDEGRNYELRFIVLSRERGGSFEIINEGDMEEYEKVQ